MSEQAITLAAGDFSAFYRHVHDRDPFPWQDDLVARVLADGCWPDLVDVPTGLGKTSMLDIAVFVAAATAADPGAGRVGRRRCFFVVDRRIVVDEAFEHAATLADAIGQAEGHDGVAGQVAAGLRAYAPEATGALLPVTRMRGGTTWDAAWLDRPDRPGIVLGTVDQVGSRLLFRGYGVSDRRRPLDAALVGTDALVLVDEAHLATALLTTVTAACSRDALGLPLPGLDVVRLSATGEPTSRTHRLDEAGHRDHPVAWQRLTAGKRLLLRASTAKTCARDLAGTVVDRLTALDGAGEGAPVALVVCNTVDRAREVHIQLRKTLAPADCELLIGRSRPLDRGDLQERVLHRFGTARGLSQRPAVLVATQTVEVGVNLDVDVLVTESASWDALVQRLGRLNRLGRFVDRFPGHDAATAVVVHDGQDDGPVYGAARDATWDALNELGTGTDIGIDVSPLTCRRLTASTFADPTFMRQPCGVPVLLRPTLDAWVQTGPVPLNDPPVAPYLHGFDAGAAPVQILWREELVEPTTVADPFDDPLDDVERASPQIDALLTLWPPRSEEIVEVPFITARRWIGGLGAGPVGDVDGAAEPETRTPRSGEPFRVLAQRATPASTSSDSPLSWRWIENEQLRPGDRIVVPTRRGGLDQYGWAPADPTPVVDVSEPAGFTASRSRRDAVLRLDPDLGLRLGIEADSDADLSAALRVATTPDEENSGGGRNSHAAGLAQTLAAGLPDNPPSGSGWSTPSWQTLRSWLAGSELRIVEVTDPADPWLDGGRPHVLVHLLTGPRPAAAVAALHTAAEGNTAAEDNAATVGGAVAEGDDDEAGASSVGSGRVTLDDHHDAVGARAAQIARALALPAGLAAVVVDAARWHDLGKCDARFQIMLHGGDAVEAALAVEPLAKSGLDTTDRMAWRRAARDSKLPRGARHEAWSAALVQEHLNQHPYDGDEDLLIHLVASHHGYARPWPRLVTDTDPRPIEAIVAGGKLTVSSERTVCLDQPGRFARLNARYGRWGLALLEAIVRSADTTVSGEGS
jgi:CRISPR-associated endonuclease/helicase Cas3